MRFIVWNDTPEFYAALGFMVVLVIGIAIYSWLRPPKWKKLIEDSRYHQAISVYAANLQQEKPTDDDRQHALTLAVGYLTNEHGIPAEEAEVNLRLLVAQHDRDRSYELRQEGSFYEQAGAHDLALDYYERAAWWQAEHDPKDHQFLQQCAARVRKKVRPR
jgi:hypothetical protein